MEDFKNGRYVRCNKNKSYNTFPENILKVRVCITKCRNLSEF